MLQLIEHIIRIASRRDRTEINSALVDAMRDVFDPAALAAHRCYPAAGSMIVFTCAGLGPGGQFSHNAYLPERRYCEPIDHDPLLQCCQDERAIVREARADGADRRVLLMGLVEYFGHHIPLLDQGEADTLTGLANRKTLDKHLFQVLGKAVDDDTLVAAGQLAMKSAAH